MFETAIPGAGYGYGTQQVGPPPGTYGNLAAQFGQPVGLPVGAFGQQPFGGQVGGLAGIMGQRFGGQPLTIGTGAMPFQQIQPQFGQPQFAQPQVWPQFGQPQFGGQQFGITQPQVQVIPVVTPQGWLGLLLLATGQPLVIGATAGGLYGGLGQYQGYGYGAPPGVIGGGQAGFGGQVGGLPGGYLPLQVQQQQIPPQLSQMYGPPMPFAGPSFPGQPLGAIPIH